MHTIYKITNLKNDRYYIGCTSTSIKRRFWSHWGSRNPKFRRNCMHDDMNVQDRNDFKIEIIVHGILNKDEAYKLEHDLTDVDDELCYNQQRGDKMSQKNKDKQSKRVQCIETGEIFESGYKASLSLGFKKHAVANSIFHNTRCGGYNWKYIK